MGTKHTRREMKTYIVAYREPTLLEQDQGKILCRDGSGKVRTFLSSEAARRTAGALGVIDIMDEKELKHENEKAKR